MAEALEGVGAGKMRTNGEFRCGLDEAWQDDMFGKITETHNMMNSLIEHTSHLPKLTKISDSMTTIEGELINAATGKDHVNTKTVFLILKIFGVVICGLTAVIVYLLTGLHFGWVSSLH